MKIIIVSLCLLTIGTLLWSLKQGNHAKRPFWWRLTLIIATLTLFTAAIGTTTNVDAAQKPTVIIKKLGHSSMVKESKAHDSLLVKRDSLSAKLASLKEQLSAAESSSEEASSKEAAASAQAAVLAKPGLTLLTPIRNQVTAPLRQRPLREPSPPGTAPMSSSAMPAPRSTTCRPKPLTTSRPATPFTSAPSKKRLTLVTRSQDGKQDEKLPPQSDHLRPRLCRTVLNDRGPSHPLRH